MNLGLIGGWEDLNDEDPTIRYTYGPLRVDLGQTTATQVFSRESLSVRDFIHVPLYPLAEWLAASWWRLRWETARTGDPPLDWSMAHEMPTIGRGYVWPRVTIAFDGESVEISCEPSDEFLSEPIRYLSTGRSFVEPDTFESQIADFITLVIRRLDDLSVSETNLHALWNDVQTERDNPEFADYRKWEARLGFDPEDAPTDLVEHFLKLADMVGNQASAEIASASAGEASERQKDLTKVLKDGPFARASFAGLSQILESSSRSMDMSRPPWERGYTLATKVREHLANADEPVDDDDLGELIGMTVEDLRSGSSMSVRWIELGVRDSDADEWRLGFKSTRPDNRRFSAARYIGDRFAAPSTDMWLPLTETHTSRQKFQRAFAAQLLCPKEGLIEYLHGDFTDNRIMDAAAHYNVSEIVAMRQVENHRIRTAYQ